MAMMDFVNERDEVIGQASREEIYEKMLTHRIVHVWIFTGDGKMVLQKRSAQCSYCPLHWSVSAAGHVDAGETYEQGAKRELKEELGVELPITFVEKFFYNADPRGAKKFITVFRASSNGPFQIDPNEVAEVKMVTLTELKTMMQNGESFHPQFAYVLRNLLDRLTA